MRTASVLVIALSAGVLTLAATDPMVGTWKLNVAKSKFSPGPGPKSVTMTYTQEGDWISVKSEAITSTGETVNRSNRYKLDGQEYPFEGPQGKGMIAIKKTDDRTADAVVKFEGGHSMTMHAVVSKDGKTRTVTGKGTNAKGEKVNNTTFWERQ